MKYLKYLNLPLGVILLIACLFAVIVRMVTGPITHDDPAVLTVIAIGGLYLAVRGAGEFHDRAR